MPLNIVTGASRFSAVHLFHCVMRSNHSVQRCNASEFSLSLFSSMSVRVITENVFLMYTLTPSSCVLQEVHPHRRFPRQINFPPFRKQHQGTLKKKNVESSCSPSMLTYTYRGCYQIKTFSNSPQYSHRNLTYFLNRHMKYLLFFFFSSSISLPHMS